MFKGKSLAVLASVLVTVTCVVIYFEWRAVQEIPKSFVKLELKNLLQKGRHALLHRMIASGFHRAAAPAAAEPAAPAAAVEASRVALRGAGPAPAGEVGSFSAEKQWSKNGRGVMSSKSLGLS